MPHELIVDGIRVITATGIAFGATKGVSASSLEIDKDKAARDAMNPNTSSQVLTSEELGISSDWEGMVVKNNPLEDERQQETAKPLNLPIFELNREDLQKLSASLAEEEVFLGEWNNLVRELGMPDEWKAERIMAILEDIVEQYGFEEGSVHPRLEVIAFSKDESLWASLVFRVAREQKVNNLEIPPNSLIVTAVNPQTGELEYFLFRDTDGTNSQEEWVMIPFVADGQPTGRVARFLDQTLDGIIVVLPNGNTTLFPYSAFPGLNPFKLADINRVPIPSIKLASHETTNSLASGEFEIEQEATSLSFNIEGREWNIKVDESLEIKFTDLDVAAMTYRLRALGISPGKLNFEILPLNADGKYDEEKYDEKVRERRASSEGEQIIVILAADKSGPVPTIRIFLSRSFLENIGQNRISRTITWRILGAAYAEETDSIMVNLSKVIDRMAIVPYKDGEGYLDLAEDIKVTYKGEPQDYLKWLREHGYTTPVPDFEALIATQQDPAS